MIEVEKNFLKCAAFVFYDFDLSIQEPWEVFDQLNMCCRLKMLEKKEEKKKYCKSWIYKNNKVR